MADGGKKPVVQWTWDEQFVFDLKTTDLIRQYGAGEDNDGTGCKGFPRLRCTVFHDGLIDSVRVQQRALVVRAAVADRPSVLTRPPWQVFGTCEVPLETAFQSMETPSPEVFVSCPMSKSGECVYDLA